MYKLFTNDETAEILRIAPRTLEDWRTNGRGPNYVQCGGKPVYRERDIDAWIELSIVDLNVR